jgi:hypothetical protein
MVLPLILGLPYTVTAGILCRQRILRNLSTQTGSSVPSHSSTTNTARSLARFVLLELEMRVLPRFVHPVTLLARVPEHPCP